MTSGKIALGKARAYLRQAPGFWLAAGFLVLVGMALGAFLESPLFDGFWLLELLARILLSALGYPLYCGLLRMALRRDTAFGALFAGYRRPIRRRLWRVWRRTGLGCAVLLALASLMRDLLVRAGHPLLLFLPLYFVLFLLLFWLWWEEFCLLGVLFPQLDRRRETPFLPGIIRKAAFRHLPEWGSFWFALLGWMVLTAVVGCGFLLLLLFGTGGFSPWIAAAVLAAALVFLLAPFLAGAMALAADCMNPEIS